MEPTIGVSLKMYFGHAEALAWCRTAAAVARRHPGVVDGRLRVFVAPSFPVLPAAAEIFADSGVEVAAQDLAATDAGAYTGEVSGAELAEIGVRYVEVGHAERRRLFGESELVVATKTAAALRHGLVPVLCLGEADPGPVDVAVAECVRQLESALGEVADPGSGAPVVIAYEPHWAIGAAQPAGVDHIAPVCIALGAALRDLDCAHGSGVIYGGSAGPGLLARLEGSVSGLFLGRFAHDPDAFDQVLTEAESLLNQA